MSDSVRLVPESAPSDEATDIDASSGERRRTSELSSFDALALITAVAMIVFCLPGGWAPYGAPRLAVLLVLIGPGLVVLGLMVAERDRAATLGAAFVIWSVISAIASAAPEVALLGVANAHESVLL